MEDVLEAFGRAHPAARRAARVQAPALARLAHDAPRAVDVVVELAGAGDPAVGVLVAGPQCVRDLAQQLADAIVDRVDLVGGAAVAQRRPHEQVHEQSHGDPDAGVKQPRDEHAGVVARTGREDDERGRGGGRRLGPQAAYRAGEQADEDRDARATAR